MRTARRLLIAAAAAVACLASGSPAAAQSPCPNANAQLGEIGEQGVREAILCMVNVERTGRGLHALAADERLDRAAQAHSEDMAARDYFDHETPEGTGPGDRISAQGYVFSTWGENISLGVSSAHDLMEGWMASEGHCQNILRPNFSDLGFGIAQAGSVYSTQVFARTQEAPPQSTDDGPANACPQPLLGAGGGQQKSPGLTLETDKVRPRKAILAVRFDPAATGRLSVSAKHAKLGKVKLRKLGSEPGLERFKLKLRKPGRYTVKARFAGESGWASERDKLKLRK